MVNSTLFGDQVSDTFRSEVTPVPDTPIYELKIGMPMQTELRLQPEADAVTRKLYADVTPSIVKIDTPHSTGSGFFLDKDGDVATDAHCVLGENQFNVITADGVKHNARLVKLDDIDDLAVLRIDDTKNMNIKPLALGASAGLKADQNLWSFGHPDGADPTYVAPGYFRNVETGQDVLNGQSDAATARAQKVMDKMTPAELADAKADLSRAMFNARINVLSGDSGGPVLDQQGRVVGINDFSNDKSDSDFTPVEKLIALMNETKPKFNFVHKPDKDGNLILTDISRTDGTVRPPFQDNVIVEGDSHSKCKPNAAEVPLLPYPKKTPNLLELNSTLKPPSAFTAPTDCNNLKFWS